VLREFFAFDLRFQLRSPLLWITALVVAFLAFAATSTDGIQIGGSIGNVHRNSPYVIASMFGVFSVLGLFIVTAFVAQPLLRDAEMRTDELFFATPMRKRDYLWGRWAAGVVAAVFVYVCIALGMLIASVMPWLDPERLGPFSLKPYLWSLGVLVVPNMIFIGALLALLAVTTRKLLAVYIGVIAFFVLWTIAQQMTSDVEYRSLGALLDPFGAEAFAQITRYWSANERNTQLPALAGNLLLNRVVWLGIGAVLIAIAHMLFHPLRAGTHSRPGLFKRRKSLDAQATPVAATSRSDSRSARTPAQISVRSQFVHQFIFDARGVLRSVPFLIILAFAIFNLGASLPFLDQLYGTSVYPVTSLMLDLIRGSFAWLLAIVVAYYGGELVWRERDAKLSELTDALPIPNWVPLLSKTIALFCVVLIFMCVGVATTAVFQLLKGYVALELITYLKGIAILSAPFMLTAVAAIFVQVVSNNKFVGYLLFIVWFVGTRALVGLDFEHNLYQYGSTSGAQYSDMNGYGHFLEGWAWFNAYWAALAVALLLIASAFWPRGLTERWHLRWRSARAHLHGARGVALAASLVVFVALGGWIFYNTNVLNEYVTSDENQDRQAHYERQFRQFKSLPQPTITAVRTDVDIFPKERRLAIRGHYALVNKNDVPVTQLHVNVPRDAKTVKLEFAPATLEREDELVHYRIYTLEQPLAPGATLSFDFTLDFPTAGFENNTSPGLVLYNGTFFDNSQVLPQFGYQESAQLVDRAERRKRDLGDVPRMAKLEDKAAQRYNFISHDDWIDFEATVSTSEDQIALAPGYLQKEWTENGRRHFHYKMDRPMMPYFCFLSARWEVAKGEWNGMPIEVYYDRAHAYNAQRMIEATKKSLDYFTREFSPYQHKQVRILEFPRYRQFAQSFANTIPFSESIGFIANLEDPEDIDYVFYVTAHEVAHQWWGHQILGADVQGSSMLSESLSQYSALMVMEKEYGRDQMRRFLKYELDRYLAGRGSELIEEQPLMRVENQQYIHYAKGSLIFYRLRDEIGEEALNRALARYLQDKAFQEPPYTTSQELLTYIRDETPAAKHAMLEELFAKIVFYNDRVTAATAHKRDDGKYDVTIEYAAAKTQSDGKGVESPLPFEDEIEVGVFARSEAGKDKVLYFDKHRLAQQSGKLTVEVASEPYEAGIDPYNKLIDREPDDNRMRVTIE